MLRAKIKSVQAPLPVKSLVDKSSSDKSFPPLSHSKDLPCLLPLLLLGPFADLFILFYLTPTLFAFSFFIFLLQPSNFSFSSYPAEILFLLYCYRKLLLLFSNFPDMAFQVGVITFISY